MECCWLQHVRGQARTASVVLEPAVWRRNRPAVAVGSHRPLLTDSHGGRVVPHAVSLWGKNPAFLEEHIQRCSPPNPQRWRLKDHWRAGIVTVWQVLFKLPVLTHEGDMFDSGACTKYLLATWTSVPA